MTEQPWNPNEYDPNSPFAPPAAEARTEGNLGTVEGGIASRAVTSGLGRNPFESPQEDLGAPLPTVDSVAGVAAGRFSPAVNGAKRDAGRQF